MKDMALSTITLGPKDLWVPLYIQIDSVYPLIAFSSYVFEKLTIRRDM